MSYSSQPAPFSFSKYSALTLVLAFTCGASVLSGLFELLAVKAFGIGPEGLFTLHYPGFEKMWLWQFVTHLFVYGRPGEALSFSLLIDLAFQMLLLALLGSQLVSRMGVVPFLRFYLLAGVVSGGVALLMMPLTGEFTVLAGAGASILAVTLFWTMANPEAEMLLYFVVPVRARILLVAILGAILLVALAQGFYIDAIHLLSAALFAYGYATIGYQMRSPFEVTHKFDYWLGRLLERRPAAQKSAPRPSRDKIINIATGNALHEDEAFMDRMLDKVSKFGESSLSREERSRMDHISQKKH